MNTKLRFLSHQKQITQGIGRFMVFASLMAGTSVNILHADPTFDTTGTGTWTNSGEFNPGGAGTTSSVRYANYKQNFAYNLTANATQSSNYNGTYVAGVGVDGTTFMENNGMFTHNSGSESTPWWQVKVSATDVASFADLSSVAIYQRLGFTGRLDDFTISIYTVDPSLAENAGVEAVWTSDSQTTFPYIKNIGIDTTGVGDAENIWIRVTNHVSSTNKDPLSMSEFQLFSDAVNTDFVDTNVHGSQIVGGKQYVANNFTQTDDGILTLDVDYSQAVKYDSLDVAGAFFADGTLNVNFASSETITDSTLKVLNAYKIYGTFDTIRLQNVDNLNAQGKFVNITSFKNNLAGGLVLQSGTVLNSSTAQNVAWNDANIWSGATANADVYVGLYATANGGADQSVTLTTTDTVKSLTLGYNAGANGALTVADGANLTITDSLTVGAEGNGVLTQTGGEVKVNNNLYVGRHPGSTATVSLSGGKFTANTADHKNLIAYGSNTNVTFNISDNADVTITGMDIASGANSRGTVTVSGGKLTSQTGAVRIGNGGNSVGKLIQTGGEIILNSETYLSDSNTSTTGEIALSGGKFTANKMFCIGVYNNASMTISGTSEFTATNQFIIGYGLGRAQNPTVKQLGGTATIQNGIQFGNGQGQAVNGIYQMTGGTLTTSKIFENDKNNNVTGLFSLSGTAKADVSGDISVPVVMNNGTLNAGSISSTATVSGGQLDVGTINGEVTMTGGTLSPGGNGKIDTITVANGGKLTLDSAGVIESGNIALSRPAAQSSNYNTNNDYPASAAVNGNKGDFTHTSRDSGKNQWWEVEFAESTKVSTVNLFNRGGFDHRLIGNGNGYHFELYDGTIANPGTLLWSSPIYTEYTSGATINLDTPVDGKLLRLVRDFNPTGNTGGDDLTLNLAEVEVYSNQNLVAMMEMDLFADGTSDQLVLNEGATLELDDAGIKLNFDTTQMPESNLTWDIFSIADGATITGEFSVENMILPELTGFWEWDFSNLYSMGKLSLTNADPSQVPEPATWVLLVLGFATLGIVRTRSRS